MLLLVLLGILAQEPDVDALLKQLSDESIEVREKAAAALIALGEKAEEPLRKAIATASGELKNRGLAILSRIGRDRRIGRISAPPGRVTIEGENLEFDDVANQFAKQTGWPLSDRLAKLPDLRLSIKVRDALPFQALEAIARASRRGYEFRNFQPRSHADFEEEEGDGDPTIFKPGGGGWGDIRRELEFQVGPKPAFPSTFVRHYLLSLKSIQLLKRNDFKSAVSRGEIQVELLWSPLLRPHRLVSFELTGVEDDQGRALVAGDTEKKIPRPEGRYDPDDLRGEKNVEAGLPFRYPEADAKSLKSIRGTVALKHIVEEQVLTIEKPAESIGKSFQLGAVEVRLVSLKAFKNSVQLALEISGFEKGETPVADDVKIRSPKGLFSDWGQSGTSFRGPMVGLSMSAPVKELEVQAIEIVVGRIYHVDKIDFELKDIPLPK